MKFHKPAAACRYLSDVISCLVKLGHSASLPGVVICKVYLASMCILNKPVFVNTFTGVYKPLQGNAQIQPWPGPLRGLGRAGGFLQPWIRRGALGPSSRPPLMPARLRGGFPPKGADAVHGQGTRCGR